MKKLCALLLTALLILTATAFTASGAAPEVSGSVSQNKTETDVCYSVSFSAPAARETELMRREAYEKISAGLTDAQIAGSDDLAFLLYPVEAVIEMTLENGAVYEVGSVNVTAEKAELSLLYDLLPALAENGAYNSGLADGFDFELSLRVAVNMDGAHSSGGQLGGVSLGRFSAPATSYIKYDLPSGADNGGNPVFLFYPFKGDVILAYPVRAGYTFTGWVSGGTAIDRIPEGTRYMEVISGWRVKTFQVKYVLTTRAGYNFIKCKNPNPSEFAADTGFELTDAAAPTGWVFRGWYLSSDLSGEPVTEIPGGTQKDIILYAKWLTTDEAEDEEIAAAKWGDLDSDGAVTAADARIALRAAVGLDRLDGDIIRRADFAGQGRLTATTARHLLRISVNIDTLKDVLRLYGII